jgi:hypothetical protein
MPTPLPAADAASQRTRPRFGVQGRRDPCAQQPPRNSASVDAIVAQVFIFFKDFKHVEMLVIVFLAADMRNETLFEKRIFLFCKIGFFFSVSF